MSIRILTSARNDLADGMRFYEIQAPGLGAYFLDSLSSDIDSLQLYAGIHRKVFDFHRMLSKRFPWTVYYRVEGDEVLVFRVLDARRDPGRIRAALRDL